MAQTATRKRLSRKQYDALTPEEKKARRAARMEEATSSYETAIRNLTEGDTFRQHLQAVALCHNYSLRNTFWVMAQTGEKFIPPIASYKTWHDDLGYQVRKGEHGSMIWVPTPVKIEDENGEETKVMRFKTGNVFTRSQVDPIEGKALSIDPPAPAPITGDSHRNLIPKLRQFAISNGYQLKELAADEQPDVEGYHDKAGKVIAFRPDRPANAIVRCLVHEIIHGLGIGYQEFGRDRAEIITDSATYLTCRLVGLDVEKTSIPYVAGWGAHSVDTIAGDLGLMQQLANQVIDGAKLHGHLASSEADVALRSKSKKSKAAKTA